MPVSFRIRPERGRAHVHFEGKLTVAEAAATFADYARPPQRAQSHTSARHDPGDRLDADFAGLMRLHVGQTDVLLGAKDEILYMYHAPDEPRQALAIRSREDGPGVVATRQETDGRALQVLGQPQQTFDARLQSA